MTENSIRNNGPMRIYDRSVLGNKKINVNSNYISVEINNGHVESEIKYTDGLDATDNYSNINRPNDNRPKLVCTLNSVIESFDDFNEAKETKTKCCIF